MKSLLILYTGRLLGPICLKLEVIGLLIQVIWEVETQIMNLMGPADPVISNLAQSIYADRSSVWLRNVCFLFAFLSLPLPSNRSTKKSKKIDPRIRTNPFITLAH